MQQQSWYEKLNSTFENDYDTFSDILHSTLENHSPLSTPPIKKKNMYMTNEAIRLKNAKGRLWNRYVATRTKYDREKYTQCKNSLLALTRNLKRDFEQNLACNLKGKPKTFWKYVKSRLKTSQSIPSEIVRTKPAKYKHYIRDS